MCSCPDSETDSPPPADGIVGLRSLKECGEDLRRTWTALPYTSCHRRQPIEILAVSSTEMSEVAMQLLNTSLAVTLCVIASAWPNGRQLRRRKVRHTPLQQTIPRPCE